MRLLLALLLAGCATATPTPAPTMANLGLVRFGSEIDDATLALVGSEKSTFTQTDQLAYVAVLSEPAHAATLRLVIAKQNGAAETALVDQAVSISNPDFQVVGNRVDMAAMMPFLDGPGQYVMRFLRDATLLAQGAFTIVPG